MNYFYDEKGRTYKVYSEDEIDQIGIDVEQVMDLLHLLRTCSGRLDPKFDDVSDKIETILSRIQSSLDAL